jgi:signal transduction histidine kinase
VRYRIVRLDGSIIWLEKNAHAFFDSQGAIVRMIGMVSDINDQKVAEEAMSSLSRKLIEAQETERARIARDLHDDIGQRLAVLSVMLDRIKEAAPNSKSVHNGIQELRKQIFEISGSIHTMSHELHSASLRHLELVKAMRGFCRELSQQRRVEITFVSDGVQGTMPQDISLCLFRVLQEALHNAIKHSGVRIFAVHLRGTPDEIQLTVGDSGIGFDPTAAINGGLGLTSMRERLKLVDGTLFIESRRDLGSTIRASVPLPAKPLAATPKV